MNLVEILLKHHDEEVETSRSCSLCLLQSLISSAAVNYEEKKSWGNGGSSIKIGTRKEAHKDVHHTIQEISSLSYSITSLIQEK